MAALLGFALGAGIGAERQKIQRQHQMDDTLINMAIQNPSVATDPDIQKLIKKRGSPELATYIGKAAQAQQQMQQDIAGATSGGGAPNAGAPSGMAMANGGAPASGGAIDMTKQPDGSFARAGQPSPAAQTGGQPDEMQQHIGTLDDQITKLRAIATKYAANPSFAPYEAHIESAIRDLQSQRNQLQAFSQQDTKQQNQFQQQNKLESDRFSQQNKLESDRMAQQNKTIEAIAARQQQAEKFQFDLQTRREDQQDHLQSLRDAHTTADRQLKMKQIVANLGKTTADLSAKLGKGSDYDQQQREMSANSHNEYIDSLISMTDDPAQVEQLNKLKLNVGAATSTYGGLSSKPGAVGSSESARPAGVPDGSTHGTSKTKGPGWLTPDGRFIPDSK